MLNFIKYIMGEKIPSPEANQIALEFMGRAMLTRIEREQKIGAMSEDQEELYMSNKWLNEQSQKTFGPKFKKLLKHQQTIAKIYDDILSK